MRTLLSAHRTQAVPWLLSLIRSFFALSKKLRRTSPYFAPSELRRDSLNSGSLMKRCCSVLNLMVLEAFKRFRVPSSEFRVPRLGYRVPGTGLNHGSRDKSLAAVTLALPRIVVSVSTGVVAAIIQPDGSFPALAGIELRCERASVPSSEFRVARLVCELDVCVFSTRNPKPETRNRRVFLQKNSHVPL